MTCEQKLSKYFWCLTLLWFLILTSELGALGPHKSVNSVIDMVGKVNLSRKAASKPGTCHCSISKDDSSKPYNTKCNIYCKRGNKVPSTPITTVQPKCKNNCKRGNNVPTTPITTVQPSLELQQQKTVEVPPAKGSNLATNYITGHQSNVEQNTFCSNCGKKSTSSLLDAELQQLRIADIKSQILNRLRMTKRPEVTISRNMVPTPIMQWDVPYKTANIAEKNIDDYFAKTEQMIIMSEIVEYPFCLATTSDPAGCFSFIMNDDLQDKDITSAKLWVFKLRDERDKHNQTYIVTDFVRDNQSIVKRTNTVAIRDTSLKDGWLKFDLTTTVQRWIQKPNTSVQMLEISCKTCAMDKDKVPVSSDPGERPFIAINFNHEEDKKRYRRGIACEENIQSCCMESLYVNFTDIDWNDWIFQPEGYYANYCRGSCVDEITMGINKHTSVIQKYLLKNKRFLSERKIADLTPCCTSTRTSHLQILYLDNSKNVRTDIIPNMAVESCGCS